MAASARADAKRAEEKARRRGEPMTYEDCMAAILIKPEDDAPRHRMASLLESTDPDRAEFIRLQLESAIRRRKTGTRSTHARENDLENEHYREWSRDLDMFMGELGIHRAVEYDR